MSSFNLFFLNSLLKFLMKKKTPLLHQLYLLSLAVFYNLLVTGRKNM